MLRADLDAARCAWIDASSSDDERADRERSDTLVYRDARGRVADFHALRHTFISTLARALRVACSKDARMAATLPSTKGLL